MLKIEGFPIGEALYSLIVSFLDLFPADVVPNGDGGIGPTVAPLPEYKCVPQIPPGRSLRYVICSGRRRTKNHFVTMKKYRCTVCQYLYDPEAGDPENGIAPGTSFDDLPDGWICPVCGAGKEAFEPVGE